MILSAKRYILLLLKGKQKSNDFSRRQLELTETLVYVIVCVRRNAMRENTKYESFYLILPKVHLLRSFWQRKMIPLLLLSYICQP